MEYSLWDNSPIEFHLRPNWESTTYRKIPYNEVLKGEKGCCNKVYSGEGSTVYVFIILFCCV